MKKLAMIQFGAIDEVTKAYEGMCIKKKEDHLVRSIDILNPSKEDESFLESKDLYQINIVGHSATWDKKGSLIPMKDRTIGLVSVEKACAILFELGKKTCAYKYNIYPCEIADKCLENDVEMRAQTANNGILCLEEDLSFSDLLNLKEQWMVLEKDAPNNISTFDKLSLAILFGRCQNTRVLHQPLRIGGQVGPGDPHGAEDVGSPRRSIPRELARQMQTSNKKLKAKINKDINAFQKKQFKEDKPALVWIDRHVRLFRCDVLLEDNHDEEITSQILDV